MFFVSFFPQYAFPHRIINMTNRGIYGKLRNPIERLSTYYNNTTCSPKSRNFAIELIEKHKARSTCVYLLYGEKKVVIFSINGKFLANIPRGGRTKVSKRAAGASVRLPFIYLLPYDLFGSVHSFLYMF